MTAENPPSLTDAVRPQAQPVAARPKPQVSAQAGRFYRINSSRSSFAELWRDVRSPLVLIVWITKLLRIKLDGSVNDPNVVSLRPFYVSPKAINTTIPMEVLQKLAPVVRELTELGFANPVHFLIDDPFHHSQIVQIALLHRDGRSVARVTHRSEGAGLKRIHFFTEFISGLADKSFVYSSTAKAQMYVPEQVRLNWAPGDTTSQLWVSHQRALEAALASTRAYKLSDRRHLVEILERHHRAVRDFQLERGVFSSLQGEDLAQVEALDRNRELASTGQMRHPDVMTQLDRIQHRKANWANGLVVLAVSIALFIGIGMKAWGQSWEFILMIVGILLVHEAGHFVAMRMLGYRNVQMFFIPLFGAAVKGENYTAPGWKKVVVSLMGPVPGVVIGAAIGIAGLAKGNQTLTTVALLTIALNGLQLIPVLPLDGGRVMHAIIFCRHYYLDTIFQAAAGGLIAFIGAVSGDYLLIGLGTALLVGVPVTFKVAKIADELRVRGFGGVLPPSAVAIPAGATNPVAPPGVPGPAVPTDAPTVQYAGARSPQSVFDVQSPDGTIPRPVAETIIDQVRERMPKIKSPKQIAQLTLRVYETLATRPPGAGASIGLVFVHGASFCAAVVMLIVLAVGQSAGFAGFGTAGGFGLTPSATLDPSQVQIWTGPAEENRAAITTTTQSASRANPVVITTFSTVEQATQAFEDVRANSPGAARAVCFGQSLLLSVPDADAAQAWFDKFDSKADDVFITSDKFSATLMLSCTAGDARRQQGVIDRLGGYFHLESSMRLIPIWISPAADARSPEERAEHDALRAFYRRLQQISFDDDPKIDAIRKQMAQAIRRSDNEEYARLRKQINENQVAQLRRKLERFRADAASEAHRTLIDRYESIQCEWLQTSLQVSIDDEDTYGAEWQERMDRINRRRAQEMGPLLGQLSGQTETADGTPWHEHPMYRFGSAWEDLNGRMLVMVQFVDPARDLPRFVDWLVEQGCQDFQYEFNSDTADYGFDDY